MSFPKTLPGDKTMSHVAATAAGMVIVWGIYMLRPEIGGFEVTIVASMIAFLMVAPFPLTIFWRRCCLFMVVP
jgi:hypothetical protein